MRKDIKNDIVKTYTEEMYTILILILILNVYFSFICYWMSVYWMLVDDAAQYAI
jgi:hypothetical protein